MCLRRRRSTEPTESGAESKKSSESFAKAGTPPYVFFNIHLIYMFMGKKSAALYVSGIDPKNSRTTEIL
jgi:hypothetical protein